MVAEEEEHRARGRRLDVLASEDGGDLLGEALEAIVVAGPGGAQARLAEIELHDLARAGALAAQGPHGAAAGDLRLGVARGLDVPHALGAAAEQGHLRRRRGGERGPEHEALHADGAAREPLLHALGHAFAHVEAHRVDEEQLDGARAVEAGDAGRDLGDVEDHRRPLARHAQRREGVAVAVLEGRAPAVDDRPHGGVDLAARDGAEEREVAGHEEALDHADGLGAAGLVELHRVRAGGRGVDHPARGAAVTAGGGGRRREIVGRRVRDRRRLRRGDERRPGSGRGLRLLGLDVGERFEGHDDRHQRRDLAQIHRGGPGRRIGSGNGSGDGGGLDLRGLDLERALLHHAAAGHRDHGRRRSRGRRGGGEDRDLARGGGHAVEGGREGARSRRARRGTPGASTRAALSDSSRSTRSGARCAAESHAESATPSRRSRTPPSAASPKAESDTTRPAAPSARARKT